MKIRLGIDVACRAAHQASCADDAGVFAWSGHRFRTDPADLEILWAKLPAGAEEVVVIIEPTRNAWVPLAAWLRRQGAKVVVVPPKLNRPGFDGGWVQATSPDWATLV